VSDRFDLTANILSVTFAPRDTVRIDGMLWSKHQGGVCVGDTTNRYNKQWFWDSSLPAPVKDVLSRATAAATEDLVKRKALPTFWPTGLMAEKESYPFEMTVESLTIYNSDWNKDKLSEAKFLITSEHHLGSKFDTANQIHSTVAFDEGWKLNDEIFEILYEHM